MSDISIYIMFSHEDPHYRPFLNKYMSDFEFRQLFDGAVLSLRSDGYCPWVYSLVAENFGIKVKSVLSIDIIMLHKSINEDLRRIAAGQPLPSL